MTHLANSASLRQIGTTITVVQVPIYAAAKIYQGAMVALLTASGYAVRAGTASTGAVQGVAQAEAAAPASSGDVNVNLRCGLFAFALHATHTPTIADVGKVLYASDDNTLSNDAGDGPVAGICTGFEASSGWGFVYIHPSLNYVLDQSDLSENLASVVNALGASLIGLEDAGAFTAAATVEAAIAELYQNLKSATVTKEIPISAMILAAGTPMAAWADNAGASAPGITLANSEAMGLRWNDEATQVAVFGRFNLPDDIDVTANAAIHVYASKTGATDADDTTFDVALFNNALAALHDADANYGGTTTAMVGTATAKTVAKLTLAITAADLGVAGEPVTFSIKPTNGTLETDDVIVHGINLVYKRKLKTS